MIYKIEASAYVTILESLTIEVEADSYEEAAEQAIIDFDNKIKNKYPWADYDEIRTEECD